MVDIFHKLCNGFWGLWHERMPFLFLRKFVCVSINVKEGLAIGKVGGDF